MYFLLFIYFRVNTYDVFPQQSAFGGFKQSGIGRENGEYAFNSYIEPKTVSVYIFSYIFRIQLIHRAWRSRNILLAVLVYKLLGHVVGRSVFGKRPLDAVDKMIVSGMKIYNVLS